MGAVDRQCPGCSDPHWELILPLQPQQILATVPGTLILSAWNPHPLSCSSPPCCSSCARSIPVLLTVIFRGAEGYYSLCQTHQYF